MWIWGDEPYSNQTGLHVQKGGNVGVGYQRGTQIDTYKLSVNGSGYFAGTLSALGNISVGGGLILKELESNSAKIDAPNRWLAIQSDYSQGVGIGYSSDSNPGGYAAKLWVNGGSYFNGGLVATADSTIGKNEAVSHRLQILTGAANSAYIHFYPYSMYGFVLGNFNVGGNNQFQLRNNADEVVLWVGNNNSKNLYLNGPLRVETTTSADTQMATFIQNSQATFNWGQLTLAPNMTTNTHVINLIGVAGTTRNSAYMGFTYVGSGSYSNKMTFGFHSNNHLLTIDPYGDAVLKGSLFADTYNKAGIMVKSNGTDSSGAAFAIQQVTAEGWTGIFVDYEPNTGWGLYHDNPNNYFCITAEASTGSLRSFTVPSRSSGNRTAYEKIRFEQTTGNILAGGSVTATAFYHSSDMRLKNVIKPLEPTLGKLRDMDTFYYTLKSDTTEKVQLGMSAQEFEDKFPTLVGKDSNDKLQLEYARIAVLAVKAIQELDVIQQKYEERVEDLQNQINELKQIIYGANNNK